MDLHEHALTETARTLKRLGISHCYADRPQPEAAPTAVAVRTESIIPNNCEQTVFIEQAIPPVLRPLFHGKHYPVHSMWVYDGLCSDLLAPSQPDRLQIIMAIMRATTERLGWQPEKILLWPLDQPAAMLQQALQLANPGQVLLFETEGLDAKSDRNSFLQLLQQFPLTRIPNLDLMARGDRAAKNAAWQIIQSIAQA